MFWYIKILNMPFPHPGKIDLFINHEKNGCQCLAVCHCLASGTNILKYFIECKRFICINKF